MTRFAFSGRVRALVTTLALVAAPALSAASFAGQNLGAIPDSPDAAGRTVTFPVSGQSGRLRTISLSMTLTHSFISDLDVRLISPGGVAQLVVFSRANRVRAGVIAGTGANLAGTYVFSDASTGNLWATIGGQAGSFNVPPGGYRTTTGGRENVSDVGGCSTHMNLAFGGLSGTKLNGNWSLAIVDKAGGDVGTITDASLFIETGFELFGSSFEDGEFVPPPVQVSSTLGTCKETFYDFTGTGVSSYTTVRNTGGGPTGAITWFVRGNDGTTIDPEQSFVLGTAADRFIDGDFDGDGIRDAGVYSAGASGRYTIRRSSRPTDEPLVYNLGQTGDDPQVSGDYDNDNVTDIAVYRAGVNSGDPSRVLIQLSTTGKLREFIAGQNGDFPDGGLDFSGDGDADFKVQRNDGGGNARFFLFEGAAGAAITNFVFGAPTDVIVSGNHVGNSVGDTTVVRGSMGNYLWTTRDGSSNVVSGPVTLGLSASDFVLTGDYDGDGNDDYAVWRPNITPAMTKFIVRRSSDPVTPLEVPMGQNGDYPVANGRRH